VTKPERDSTPVARSVSRRRAVPRSSSERSIRNPEDAQPDLAARFAQFADVCSEFSKEIVEQSGFWTDASTDDHARMNLEIAQSVFSKWSIDILACLYANRTSRFQEIKNVVGDISSRVLSVKLARLEDLGLVHRAVLDTRPPRVEYSLTGKGLRVATLGEPVFLYLRFTEGSFGLHRP